MIRDIFNDLFAVGICLILLAFFIQLFFGSKGVGTRLYAGLASMFKGAGSGRGESIYRKMAEENKVAAGRYFVPLVLLGVILVLISLASKI
ncbi:hypothetical protein [Marinobacter algicola]|uniref:hypothetical protein n=1 Tax=Marinobacter algicola TaxID=236100 RepID=UPI003BA8A892